MTQKQINHSDEFYCMSAGFDGYFADIISGVV